MLKWIRESKFKPTWMAAGAITGGLIAYDLRYGVAFFVLTTALWLSYTYGYCKGAGEMHIDIFTRIEKEILIPLKSTQRQMTETAEGS